MPSSCMTDIPASLSETRISTPQGSIYVRRWQAPAAGEESLARAPIVLRHSVGGGMAAMVAARYGAQCKAVITESAQAFVEDRTLQGIRAAQQDFARPGQLARLEKYHGDKAAWVLSAWVDTWLSQPFADYRLDEALERVRCPVLAIHGEHDEFGSLVHPERIRDRARGPVEVEIVAGGGHVPHREQPERIAQRIARFLARV